MAREKSIQISRLPFAIRHSEAEVNLLSNIALAFADIL